MYAMIGKEQPAQAVRFQVVNKGTGAYHVVERSTGKVMGMCFTWKAAVIRAQVLEARADGKNINGCGHQGAFGWTRERPVP